MLPVHSRGWIGYVPENPEVKRLRELEELYTYCVKDLGAPVDCGEVQELAKQIEEQKALIAGKSCQKS